jgi:hypothetical protein
VAALDVLPELPDFLGKRARVDGVATMLGQAQSQLGLLERLMLVNSDDVDDPVRMDLQPGQLPPANVPTYRERIAQLNEGMAALWAENADIHEELREESKARQKKVERTIERSLQE